MKPRTYTIHWSRMMERTACILCMDYIPPRTDFVYVHVKHADNFTHQAAVCVTCAEEMHIDQRALGPDERGVIPTAHS